VSRNNHKRAFIDYLPIYGSIATGIVYFTVGTIAILSFLKVRQGGADEASILAIMDDYLIGRIVIWIILLGTLSYIIWRIYETIKDPYNYGKDLKGIARRCGIALSAVADALIINSGVRILLGSGNIQIDGQPEEEREFVRQLLESSWGGAAVIAVGAAYIVSAVIQLVYGVTNGYKERIDILHSKVWTNKSVQVLAWYGYVARGIILGIIGFFFLKAGIEENEKLVVNTDKAFDFIGDHIGHVYFVVVALGTMSYGIFMWLQGFYYESND
jgi:hypothetical protein